MPPEIENEVTTAALATDTTAPAADPAAPAADTAATDEDKFSDAFEEFGALADDLAAPKKKADDLTPAPAPAPAAALVPDAAPAANPTDSTEPTETPEQLVTRLQTELAALKAAPVAVAPEPEKPAAPEPAYTAAEQDVLSTYQKDWPEVIAGEQLIRREEYKDLVSHVFREVQKRYDHLLPFAEQVETDTQYTRIMTLAPDYPAVRKPTLDWIEKQPEYLKKAYNEVVTSGTPEDVVDLINRFKAETKYQPPAVVSILAAAVPAAGGMAEPGAAARKATAALKVVATERTAPTDSEDPNDFSGAFEEFTKVKK